MKLALVSSMVIGLITVGAAYAAPNQTFNNQNIGTNTTNMTDNVKGVIDIESIRKQTNIDHVSDESVGIFKKQNTEILKQVKIAEGKELSDEIKGQVENLDKVQLPNNKVPSYVNDSELEKQRGMIDLERITKQYNDALLKEHKQQDDLSDFDVGRAYLFISSTIPKKTLEKLLNDAGKYNVAVFLKGNIGPDPLKFAGTQEFMQKLDVTTPPELFIHPDAFQMFKIERVPALVVAASDTKNNLDEQGCAAPNDYDIIYGDLSIGYNLTKIFENASSPDIKDVARNYMKYIRTSGAL